MLTLKQLRDDKQAAIRKLAKKHVDAEPVINRIEELDDERKAAMVSNLLVVLCADEAAQPVVNAGTLHH